VLLALGYSLSPRPVLRSEMLSSSASSNERRAIELWMLNGLARSGENGGGGGVRD